MFYCWLFSHKLLRATGHSDDGSWSSCIFFIPDLVFCSFFKLIINWKLEIWWIWSHISIAAGGETNTEISQVMERTCESATSY